MPSAGEKQPNPRRTPQPVTRRFAAIFRFFAGASGCSDSTGDGADVVAGQAVFRHDTFGSGSRQPRSRSRANPLLVAGAAGPREPGSTHLVGPRSLRRLLESGRHQRSEHAPYFHDGSAARLDAVVQHDDAFLRLRLDAREKTDLVEFLKSL